MPKIKGNDGRGKNGLNLANTTKQVALKFYVEQIIQDENEKIEYLDLIFKMNRISDVLDYYVQHDLETVKKLIEEDNYNIYAGLTDTEKVSDKALEILDKYAKDKRLTRYQVEFIQRLKTNRPSILQLSSEYEKLRTRRKEIEKNEIDNFMKRVDDVEREEYILYAVYHDRDVVQDKKDMFDVSYKKGHFHVLAYKKNKQPFHIYTLIIRLGINYNRKDTSMFTKHGAEGIRDISAYIVYLLHKTDVSILKGKTEYSLSELHGNYKPEEWIKAYKTYKEGTYQKNRLTDADWNERADLFFQFGKDFVSFEKMTNRYFTVKQQAQAPFKVVTKKYNRGLKEGASKAPENARCSILISGTENDGKSFNTIKSAEALNLKVFDVTKGNGKYDGLSADDELMIMDDVSASSALNVFDNRACVLPARFHNVVWTGKYAVITTNLTPEKWIKRALGLPNIDLIDMDSSDRITYNALLSRLYLTHIQVDSNGNRRLVTDKLQNRGNEQSKELHNLLYKKFADAFNNSIKDYKKENKLVEPKIEEYLELYPQDVARIKFEKAYAKYQSFKDYLQVKQIGLDYASPEMIKSAKRFRDDL